jgi:hypothetical protein
MYICELKEMTGSDGSLCAVNLRTDIICPMGSLYRHVPRIGLKRGPILDLFYVVLSPHVPFFFISFTVKIKFNL